MDRDTRLLSKEIEFSYIKMEIHEICCAIMEKGYNVESQMVGYILSKDPIYITNYKDARKIISKYTIEEILNFFISYYIDGELNHHKRGSDERGEEDVR